MGIPARWAIGLSLLMLAQSTAPARALEMDYFYDRPGAPDLQETYHQLSNRNTLSQIHDYLSPLRLPDKIAVRISECGNGDATRTYVSGKDLVICYEYLQRVRRVASSAKNPDPNDKRDIQEIVVAGALAHATLHLVAQSIFDQLKMPIWGNRNDAADRLASYMMVTVSSEMAREWFYGAGAYFALSGAEATVDFTNLSSPDSQRFYDHFCFAQAASPADFAKLVGIVALRIFGGTDAEKLKRVFDARAVQDEESRMKLVEGLDPNDKVFQTRFYRRMRLCSLEYNESKTAFDRALRSELTRKEFK